MFLLLQHNVGGEAEDSDDDSVPRIGVISDSEGTEDEGEATDGPKQPPPSAENLADQPLGTAAAGAGPQGGKTSTRREGGNDYDYCDDFIDDTEFIDMLEYTDRRKLKYEGFRIYRGRLDRIDELVKGAQPDKPTRKRKGAVDAPGSDAERLKQGQEGGEEPAAKKQKKKGQGGGQGASAPSPGNGAPSGTPLSPRKPLPPYNMPADVAAAIQELRALAAAAPAPPPPDPLDPKTNRKSLPAPVLDYLKSVQHLFDREFAHHKSVFSRPVLAQLFQFLEPFTSKENLRLYVCGKVRIFVLGRKYCNILKLCIIFFSALHSIIIFMYKNPIQLPCFITPLNSFFPLSLFADDTQASDQWGSLHSRSQSITSKTSSPCSH